MTNFKAYPELSVRPPVVAGPFSIENKRGEVLATVHGEEEADRLVDCWNACSKIFAPAAHIEATDDYVTRLEGLRKEAVARLEQAEAGAVSRAPDGWNFTIDDCPKDKRVWLATKCGKVSATHWDKKREAWIGLAGNEQPVAWQRYVIPVHPNAVSDLGLNIVTKHSEVSA